MKAWLYAFFLVASLSVVTALNGFSATDDYEKNGFGVSGDIWLVTGQVDRVVGSPNGPRVVTLMDIDKGLFLPEQYSINANGLVEFAYQVGTLADGALMVESRRPRNSAYQFSAAGMPTTPQRSSIMPFRPTSVRKIDMRNRGGRYSYEGEYDLARQYIKAWKFVPYFN